MHVRDIIVLAMSIVLLSFSYSVKSQQPSVGQLLELRDQLTVMAKEGDTSASAQLGAMYLSGALGVPDYLKARKYLKEGSVTDISARLAYAHMLMNGMGGPAELLEAESEFKQAAEDGSLEGLFLSAKLALSRGVNGEKQKQAVEAMIHASRQGFPPAISALGEFYRTGTFFPMQPEKALEHFMIAAERGFFESYVYAAEMHLFAELPVTSIEESIGLYRQAVAKGVKTAYYPLAFLRYNQKQDEEAQQEAYKLAQLAAYAWDERSQYLLGLMLFEGQAVKQDLKEAYFWLDLAASAGVYESHHIRALVEDGLDAASVKATKARAKEWFDNNHSTPHKHLFIENSKHLYQ